jgi:drug/metabolite transporter (DMT)-like permease
MISLLFAKWAEPTIRYCESNLNGWIAQPANALSSLLISLAGVYIFLRKGHKFSRYLGVIAIILGLSSFAYYASFTFAGQLADLGSMYLLASLVILASLRKLSLSRRASFAFLAVSAGIPLLLTALVKTVNGFNIGIPLFGLLLAVAIYLEINRAKEDKLKLKYFAITFAALVVGYILWWLDYKKLWCSASSSHYVNGHALWHLLNAVALISLDKYYEQTK